MRATAWSMSFESFQAYWRSSPDDATSHANLVTEKVREVPRSTDPSTVLFPRISPHRVSWPRLVGEKGPWQVVSRHARSYPCHIAAVQHSTAQHSTVQWRWRFDDGWSMLAAAHTGLRSTLQDRSPLRVQDSPVQDAMRAASKNSSGSSFFCSKREKLKLNRSSRLWAPRIANPKTFHVHRGKFPWFLPA